MQIVSGATLRQFPFASVEEVSDEKSGNRRSAGMLISPSGITSSLFLGVQKIKYLI